MLDKDFVQTRQELVRLLVVARQTADALPSFGKDHWRSKESLLREIESCLWTIKHASPFLDSLPERAANCLRRGGLISVDQVCSKTPEQLLEIVNLGQVSLRQIQFALGRIGRSLGDCVEEVADGAQ
jgi:hypothetical protein